MTKSALTLITFLSFWNTPGRKYVKNTHKNAIYLICDVQFRASDFTKTTE